MDVEVSEREGEVLAAIGEHRTNAQIANRLHISVRTVESHVSSLLRKFGVPDRRALAELAAAAARRADRPFAGLPASRSSFVGREREVETVLAALRETRLVSLLGPGGMGKTRLAAVSAAAVAGSAGGAFVDLVPVRDGFVTAAVAAGLGVTQNPPQPLEDTVLDRLREGRALLVLDNCEHLVDEVSGLVERVLTSCPEASVLVTSRERLGVPGERVVQVPPLPLGSDAERLFMDRARAVASATQIEHLGADPAVVFELCGRLDGLPLAIELAAARAASLGIDGLRTALADRFRVLSGARGIDQRHRSLRAVIGWSYDLLDADERALFRRLSVFAGSFDLAAAAVVSPGVRSSMIADLLGRLTDKSLIVHRQGATGSRWRLLRTICAYAAEELAGAGEDEKTKHLHLVWAAELAGELESRIETGAWRDEFEDVADDLRLALAATPPVADPVAHRLAAALAHLTFARRSFVEARRHYLAAAQRATEPTEAVNHLLAAADSAISVSDGATAYEILLEAAELARHAPNLRATVLAKAVISVHRFGSGFAAEVPPERSAAMLDEATALADPYDERAAALLAAARAWRSDSVPADADPELARVAVEAAQMTGDPLLLVGALDALAISAANAGRTREAQRVAVERLRIVESMPIHQPDAALEVIDAHYIASVYAICVGDLPGALAVGQRPQGGDQEPLGDPIGDHPYLGLQVIQALALSGRFDEAIGQATAMWDQWRQEGAPFREWLSTHAAPAALASGLLGDLDQFELWRVRAREMARIEDPAESPFLAAFAAFVDARVAVHHGWFDDAGPMVERANASSPRRWYENYARAAAAELAVVAELPDAAEWLAAAAPYGVENAWAAACLARAEARLTGDQALLVDAVEGFTRIGARFERAVTLLLMPSRAEEGLTELTVLGCQPPA